MKRLLVLAEGWTRAHGGSGSRRKGNFLVLGFLCLVVAIAFVTFSIDTGNIALNKTLMQNGVDSAALAAAMEITHAVENAPLGQPNPAAFAKEQARAKAVEVASLNGIYVEPNLDVEFGLRSYNPATEKFEIVWGAEPANAVKVKARKDNNDVSAPDGKLPMFFAGVLGDDKVRMQAEAIAYIESRDIAVVLDFSGSMRYDSMFRDDSINKLGADAIRNNLRQMYWELDLADGALGTLDHDNPDDPASSQTPEVAYLTMHGNPQQASDPRIDVTFKYDTVDVSSDAPYKTVRLLYEDGDGNPNTWNRSTISNLNTTSGTYSGSGGYADDDIAGVEILADIPGYVYTEVFQDNNDAVKAYFGLNGVAYPYPSGSWNEYINYVRSDAEVNRGGHREMYGGITFVHFIMEQKPYHTQTPALSKTSHYPFHAVRKGNELFVDFLSDLGFGDQVGLVSYDQYRRTEQLLNEDGQSVDLSADPIGDHFQAIKAIMDYKQANHYQSRTNIGGGLRQARSMIDNYSRQGSRPTILLMTDGNANVYENAAGQNHLQSGFSNDSYYGMPAGFDWSRLQYPDGSSFYINDDGSENARARLYALSQAYKAVEEGITVHTLAVGAGADRELMQAIAWLGDGEFISVEGDLSVEDLLSEVEAGFYRIAALVPPARLADPDESAN